MIVVVPPQAAARLPVSNVSAEYVHRPWEAGAAVEGYPDRIVDHAQARDEAMAAYDKVR